MSFFLPGKHKAQHSRDADSLHTFGYVPLESYIPNDFSKASVSASLEEVGADGAELGAVF